MTIWKYPFEVAYRVDLAMQEGAEILMVDAQGGVPCIWALVDPEARQELRSFLIVGTGHKLDASSLKHVASFQQPPFVWHVFEQANR